MVNVSLLLLFVAFSINQLQPTNDEAEVTNSKEHLTDESEDNKKIDEVNLSIDISALIDTYMYYYSIFDIN